MLLYALICLCLALVGAAGLQFMYLFYLERIDAERKKRLYEVEMECRRLRSELVRSEHRIAEQQEMLANSSIIVDEYGEIWADVIEEG